MELFVIIAFTHFIALLSPGPDFFLILLLYYVMVDLWLAWSVWELH